LRVWQGWPHVRRGAAANRLRVRCEGATCRFYVNGEFTAEVTDNTFLAGDVGLWAQTFSDDALDVVFEGMRLWSLVGPRTNDE
jgi:D-aminopeptidase